MRTLIAGKDPALSKKLSQKLKNQLETEIVPVHSRAEFLKAISKPDRPFALIICDTRPAHLSITDEFIPPEDEFPADSLSLWVLIRELKSPKLEFPTSRPAFITNDSEKALDELGELLRQLFNPSPEEDYVSISLDQFGLVNRLEADVFIRIGRTRLVKRFKKEQGFEPADIEHLRASGISRIYIPKDQAEVLLKTKARDIDSPGAGIDQVRDTMGIMHDVVKQLGFTPEVEKVAKRSVQIVLKTIGSTPSFSVIRSKLKKHDGKYISSHSIMLAEIACATAYQLKRDSGGTFVTLTMAALLHDLTLSSNQIAQEKSLSEVQASSRYSKAEIEEFRMHPVRASELAKRFKEIPIDVDKILLEHHERPDGSGFPRGLFHHQISPLSSIFIFAHDLLAFYLENVPSNTAETMIKSFLRDMEQQYSVGTFKEISQTLAQSLD